MPHSRETVAFLFSDLAGSTELLVDLGPDDYGQVLSSYRAAVEDAAAPHGGEVVDREGDGIFLVFPTAVGAMQASVDAQRRLAATNWPSGVSVSARMGVHIGEAQRLEDAYIGLDIHRASRVASAAHGGQILVSEAARVLAADGLRDSFVLRDLGHHHLKGLDRDEHLHQLVVGDLRQDFPPPRTPARTPSNLPIQPTSFVGRERELRDVIALIHAHRLVTLTGVGGAGKTRLALEAAGRTATDFGDGVWLVELAAVSEPEAVPREVATTLRIRERDDDPSSDPIVEQLIEELAARSLLLVLDNCEHLLDAVARLCDRFLRSCPNVRMLATSREGLGTSGERIWQVPSLRMPDDGGDPTRSDAVRLFVERAQAVLPSFELTDDVRPLVARICRRLDGIPLAIELAAARTRTLGVERLSERLDDRFRLLTGGSRTALPRQQTLQATIDWSHQLLDDPERVLFHRLSVFAGSFDLEAAEAVCADEEIDERDVLDLLASLVDKSLAVTVETGPGPVRYRLLETLRAYARDRLTEGGEAEPVRRRHRDHFLALAERAWEDLHGPRHRRCLERLGAEREDIQAALDRSHDDHEHDAASILAYALASYWLLTGYPSRAVPLLETTLDHSSFGPEREAEIRGRLGAAYSSSGDLDASLAEIERAHALLRGAEPSSTRARTLLRHAQAITSSIHRDSRDALPSAHEALADARAIGDRFGEVRTLLHLGTIHERIWELDESATHLRTALEVARDVDDPELILAAYRALLTHLEFYARDAASSLTVADEAVTWFQTSGGRETHGRGTVDLYAWLGYVYLRVGEWDRVEETLDLMASFHVEGFLAGWTYQVRGSLRWMQGRLEEAAAESAALRALDIPRWFHDLFPVEAEIAALDGRLEDVRSVVAEYLALDVDASEQALKAAVLRPLVQAEVDACLEATGEERHDHAGRAEEALARIRRLVADYPRPPAIQFEVPETNLALAEAELSRLTGPDATLWRDAHDRCYYAYWQLYCRWRLAETLLRTGRSTRGSSELRAVHRDAVRMGAGFIRRQLEALAGSEGVDLDERDRGVSP